MFDVTQMEVGREYTIDQIPGFSPDDVADVFTDPNASMRRVFVRGLCDAVGQKTVASTFLHTPTGARFHDLQNMPDALGDPPKPVGIDDIRVLFWRV